MLFIILFTLGGLAMPLALDISKHGRNNILRRSGRDLLNYRRVQSLLRWLNIATERISSLAASMVSIVVLVVLAYVAIKSISLVGYAVTLMRN
jgi:hypothetical protein